MKELYMGGFFWSPKQQRDSCLLAWLLFARKKILLQLHLMFAALKSRGQS